MENFNFSPYMEEEPLKPTKDLNLFIFQNNPFGGNNAVKPTPRAVSNMFIDLLKYYGADFWFVNYIEGCFDILDDNRSFETFDSIRNYETGSFSGDIESIYFNKAYIRQELKSLFFLRRDNIINSGFLEYKSSWLTRLGIENEMVSELIQRVLAFISHRDGTYYEYSMCSQYLEFICAIWGKFVPFLIEQGDFYANLPEDELNLSFEYSGELPKYLNYTCNEERVSVLSGLQFDVTESILKLNDHLES